MRPPRRRFVPALTLAVALALAVTAGCGSSDTASSSERGVPFSMPSRAEIAKRAGFAFPPSTSGFESVKADDELHIALHIAPVDVAAFESGSRLQLATNRRVILHASPIWDLNPPGVISGSTSRSGSIQRAVEVIVDGDTATIRIILTDA